MKMVKINTKAVRKFIKENGFFVARLAVMGVIALHVDAASAASTAGGSSFTSVTGPLQTLQNTMTDTVAKAVGTIGIAGAALATGMNMENQIMKRAIQVTGGVAGAVGAAKLMSDVGASSGLLF